MTTREEHPEVRAERAAAERGHWAFQMLDQGWMAAYRFVHMGGEPAVAEVHVYPWRSDGSENAEAPDGVWDLADDEQRDQLTRRLLPEARATERGARAWESFEHFNLPNVGPPPPGGITARILRQMRPMEALATQVMNPVGATLLKYHSAPSWQEWGELVSDWLTRTEQQREPSDPNEPRLHRLARVAAIYSQMVVARDTRRINHRIAEMTGREASQVKDDVAAARREGFLIDAQPSHGGRPLRGQAHGVVSPKALELLAQTQQRRTG